MTTTLDISDAQLQAFHDDVLAGLLRSPKQLPSRWLYDDAGSELFEEITALEEYYPTRAETAILNESIADIAAFCGDGAIIIEYGAGAGIKTQILLNGLTAPDTYVPIDIAGDFLDMSATRLRKSFPDIGIRPVVADFTQDVDLPDDLPTGPRTAFFPGSTMGNLDRAEAERFLQRMVRHVTSTDGPPGSAIIGIDLQKPLDRLLAAYDDSLGVTAQFNLNILTRINRELDGNFALRDFAHEARWNEKESAVEMHIRSQKSQKVSVSGWQFAFEEGETIHTESSRKYTVEEFQQTAGRCGWQPGPVWTDKERLFAVVGLRAA